MFNPEPEPDVCKLILAKCREKVVEKCGADHADRADEMIADAVRLCSQANGNVHSCESTLELFVKWFSNGEDAEAARA